MKFFGFGIWGLGWRVAAVGLVCAALTGCSSYRLQGVVVAGEVPGIEVVKKGDPRWDEANATSDDTAGLPGVPGVKLSVLLDPQRLSPKMIGEGSTDAAGRFSLPIDEAGAGLLMLDVEIQAKREGYASVIDRLELPGNKQRVIVTLRRGKDLPRYEADNVLRDTLRDAEPYLRD